MSVQWTHKGRVRNQGHATSDSVRTEALIKQADPYSYRHIRKCRRFSMELRPVDLISGKKADY